jgi:hypothetical protein
VVKRDLGALLKDAKQRAEILDGDKRCRYCLCVDHHKDWCFTIRFRQSIDEFLSVYDRVNINGKGE